MRAIFRRLALLTALVMLLSFALTACGDDEKKPEYTDYEQKIIDYFAALSKGDVEEYKKCIPMDIVNYYISDEKTYFETFVTGMKSGMDKKYGDDYKLSYEFKREDKLTSNDIDVIEENVFTRFGKKIEITKGYDIMVKIHVNKDGFDEEEQRITVCMIDYKWYVLDA